jgi:hypothetical protein
LSADLPGIRQEPFAANLTRPPTGSRSLHRALSYTQSDGWHDIIGQDYLLKTVGGFEKYLDGIL